MDSLFYRGCSRREGLAEEHWRGEGMGVGWGGCACNVLCVGTSYPEVSNQVTYM